LSTKDVRGLDLSYSLISSWDVVALIVIELPYLERLFMKYVLTYVRLNTPFIVWALATTVFSHCPIQSWEEMLSLTSQSCS